MFGAHGPIVAAVDVDEPCGALLRLAAGLADALANELLLVHIVRPTRGIGRWSDAAASHDHERVSDARLRLEELAASLDAECRITTLVRLGTPAEEIASVAREYNAQAVVMTLNSAKRAENQTPGIVTYRVLCLSPAPVLALPPDTVDHLSLIRRGTERSKDIALTKPAELLTA
jgi:K+-sensing histidine kinase KdpD